MKPGDAAERKQQNEEELSFERCRASTCRQAGVGTGEKQDELRPQAYATVHFQPAVTEPGNICERLSCYRLEHTWQRRVRRCQAAERPFPRRFDGGGSGSDSHVSPLAPPSGVMRCCSPGKERGLFENGRGGVIKMMLFSSVTLSGVCRIS